MDNLMEDKPPQQCCTRFCCYKIFVLIYSLLFFLIGVILLLFGVLLLDHKRDTESINDALSNPALVCLVVGAVMGVTALIGVVGALKENVCLLRTFLVIIILVFVGQVIIGILAFVYREKAFNVVEKEMGVAIRKYTTRRHVRKAVDFIQEKFDCCGVEIGISDWDMNEDYACANTNSTLACSVPASCCPPSRREEEPDCGLGARRGKTSSELHGLGYSTQGCLLYFQGWLIQRLDAVGATALALAAIHIFGIYFVHVYMTKVEERNKLFHYRQRFKEYY